MKKSVSAGFRSDLQGLRAIAVILVILHHAGFHWVAGGFVGVDVFFVLSGFLITGLLLQEYEETGRLSLSLFYLRRLRRLLPVLMFVLGITVLVTVWFLPEVDNRTVLASLPYAASWTSNLFFTFSEQDYFNELASKDVFLHTWSLGVEEQFYLLWPVLILMLSSVKRVTTLSRVCLFLVVVSCFISVVWTHWKPVEAFYMMPARIWQFGLGGLVCMCGFHFRQDGSPVPENMAKAILGFGFALILGSGFFLDEKRLYPGYWALFPSFGAALVIFSGSLPQKVDNRKTVLAHPILV